MLTLLDLLSALADLFWAPMDIRDLRARRRKEMEELDRRPPKDWERLV